MTTTLRRCRAVWAMGGAGLLLALVVGAGVMLRTAWADEYPRRRLEMVRDQIEARGVRDHRVLEAVRKVPRHEFVLPSLSHLAYADTALPIGHDQTISQPYVVALMSELAEVPRNANVLEVGTGSGYQAAVLAQMGARVFSIELIEALATDAAARLKRLGYTGVEVRQGDGYRGWLEHAPFDAILVTAAPDHVPQPLFDQLKVGARMVIPVGAGVQELLVVKRTAKGRESRTVELVRFVPMRGEAEKRRESP